MDLSIENHPSSGVRTLRSHIWVVLRGIYENAVTIQSLGKVPLSEAFRILTPRGSLLASPESKLNPTKLKDAGFVAVTAQDDGSLLARKPWPKNMDSWTHPRHAANGNAVSQDTAVGPPERVRWIAAATSEVEGLVTADGRNFYGGVLARSFFIWIQFIILDNR